MVRSLTDDAGFLGLRGDLARRIAAHNWAATPIGPIEQWPQCLRQTVSLMLGSPAAMTLLWGTQGVMIYNDAYAQVAGMRDSRLLGSAVLEGWEEVAEFNAHVMAVGLGGGTLSYRNHMLTLDRNGEMEQVWLNLDYSPVYGEDGQPAGVIAIVGDITQAHLAQVSLEESENRLRFLDGLGRAVADCRKAEEILAITAERTARYLGVARCAYADVDADEDGFTIRGEWHAPGAPPLLGHYRLRAIEGDARAQLCAGRPFIVSGEDGLYGSAHARHLRRTGIAATVCMPLVKEGRLIALMAIHDSRPHHWNPHELAILREVTERSWAHIQRVGAEKMLREAEAYNRQILDGAMDYGIVATDLSGSITLWNSGAAAMLGWTEAEMLGCPIDVFFTPEDRESGRPAAKRREALETGRALDARWHLRKTGDRFWGLSEMSPLRDRAGHAIGFVKLMRDRTFEHEAQEALRLSAEKLSRAQVAGGVGLFSVDILDDTLTGTDEFCRLFGVPQGGAMKPELFEQLVVPEDRHLASSHARRENASGARDVEYRIRRADTGEERVIARKSEFEFDSAGNPIRMMGAVRDVTESRRAQLALQRSEAQFSILAQNMPTQVWTARADGAFDWFNDRVYAYTGEAPGSLGSEGWMPMLHPDDAAEVRSAWELAVGTGRVFDAEMRLRDARGEYRWHLARAMPLIDAHDEIFAWVGTNTEIEAQKQAEAAYAQDRDRLWTISRDLMLVCDFQGVITAVNPSAGRLLGWHDGEMLGRPIASFVHPEDLAATMEEVEKLSQGIPTIAFENRYRTRDGDYRLLAWTAVADAHRIHAIGRDITEQRSVEDALRQSHKMEAVGQLTGGIAHDFNNLLQGITGSLDMMRSRIEQGRTQDIDRWLSGARASADRAAALTHRLLAFSRRQPLAPAPVRANPLVSSIEDMLRRTLSEHIELQFNLEPGLWLTRCDPNQLESAILNLVINARDAMPEGGRLTIETCNAQLDHSGTVKEKSLKPGDYVCIAITDTGVGMDSETAARAFEPFFTTKPIGQGTGLGLSMIYGFARQSEGHARILSEPGIGTTIKLYLPRYLGSDGDDEAQQDAGPAPVAGTGEVVLVVEDEQVVRGLILDVLHDLGYQAVDAHDGPSGLAILQSDQAIDLLVTDIGLPGLNGRQLADAARALRPDLRILFMTGYAENAAMASGFLEPGMAMITKPFAMDVLAARIREIIEH